MAPNDGSYHVLHKQRLFRSVPDVAHGPNNEHLRPLASGTAPLLQPSGFLARPIEKSGWTSHQSITDSYVTKSYKPYRRQPVPATSPVPKTPDGSQRQHVRTEGSSTLIARPRAHLSDAPFGGLHGREPGALPTWENYQPGPDAWQEIYVNAPSHRSTPRQRKLQQVQRLQQQALSEFEPPPPSGGEADAVATPRIIHTAPAPDGSPSSRLTKASPRSARLMASASNSASPDVMVMPAAASPRAMTARSSSGRSPYSPPPYLNPEFSPEDGSEMRPRSMPSSFHASAASLPAQPKAPPSVHKSWNGESFDFGAADGKSWNERDVVRIVWSSLKGTYEYTAIDGTKWDDRNLEATQTGSKDLTDPTAWLPKLDPRLRAKAMPKYVLKLMKEERARARLESGIKSKAFDKARQILKRKLAGSLRRMLELFQEWDEDGSGTIDKAEFRRAAAALGWNKRDIVSKLAVEWTASDVVDAVFDEFDRDQSGQIGYHEYIRYALRAGLQKQRGRVMDLFGQWDTDKSGTVDREEFIRAVKAIGFDAPRAELDIMFDEVDADGSGAVSFGELNTLLRQGASVQIAAELQDGAVEIKRTAANKPFERTATLRKATVDELKKHLASRAQRVMDLFRSFDKNGDGMVTKAEFRAVLPMVGFDASDTEAVDALFDTLDADGSGMVDTKELHKTLRQGSSIELAKSLQDGAKGEIEVERKNKIQLRTHIEQRDESTLVPVESIAQLRDALLNGWTRVIDVFRMLDRDQSGAVTKAEFRGALPLLGFDGSDSSIIDALFDELDADAGGSLEYSEVFQKLERYEGWQDMSAEPSDAKAELIAARRMQERGELERGMGALAETQQIWHG